VFAPGDQSTWQLKGTGDSDLAGDVKTSRSTRGHYVKLGQFGAISFKCTLERKIATSTQQAETYAAVATAKDIVWLRQLLHEMGFKHDGPTILETDNQGVHLQSTKQVNHAAAKHFRIAQAYIRQLVDMGVLHCTHVKSKLNGADMFTKGTMATSDFGNCRLAVMGPQERPSPVD
jgi:hypothetical protein